MLIDSQDVSIIISILSLIVSLSALKLNRKISKLSSYNLKACYRVFLLQKGLVAKLFRQYDFSVKIYPSVSAGVIPFDYRLCIRSDIGGIYRTQIFSAFDNEFSLGINKTQPQVLTEKPKDFVPRKYANNSESSFLSTPFFPYAYAVGKFNSSLNKADEQLNRYHFYIEITDYCNNTEIWYMSFSLLLSNVKKTQYEWKKCKQYDGYEYYTFHDINITSPKDIPKNLDCATTFNKSLTEIIARKENSLESVNLIENGFAKVEYDFQLYEMKEYIDFLKRLNS